MNRKLSVETCIVFFAVADPRVAEYSVHRTAGLEMQWLIATTTTAEIAQSPADEASND